MHEMSLQKKSSKWYRDLNNALPDEYDVFVLNPMLFADHEIIRFHEQQGGSQLAWPVIMLQS